MFDYLFRKLSKRFAMHFQKLRYMPGHYVHFGGDFLRIRRVKGGTEACLHGIPKCKKTAVVWHQVSGQHTGEHIKVVEQTVTLISLKGLTMISFFCNVQTFRPVIQVREEFQ